MADTPSVSPRSPSPNGKATQPGSSTPNYVTECAHKTYFAALDSLATTTPSSPAPQLDPSRFSATPPSGRS